MSALRDMRPGMGCDSVSYEQIAAAQRSGDVDLLAFYARNLFWALEKVWPIAERARELALALDEATVELTR